MPINDSLFLDAEGREKPMHVGGLSVFALPEDAGPSTVGDLYRAALDHGNVHPRLRRRPVRTAAVGPWAWEEDENLDLAYHVRHSALPYPGRVRELLALTGRLHGTLLDRNRALWEAHIIEGLEGDRFATYIKVHHALVDGVSATKLLTKAMTTDPDARDQPPPWAPPVTPRAPREQGERGNPIVAAAGAMAGAVQGAVGGVVTGAKSIAGASEQALRATVRSFQTETQAIPYRAPRTMLNQPISGARRFAADSWSMERIKAVRKATGATLNDVVLAMCSGALRRYLLDHDGLPDESLIAAVPVSLAGEDERIGNAVGVLLCNLATNKADPEQRLQLIRESMERGKVRFRGLDQNGILLLSALAFGGLALGPLFKFEPFRKPPFNIVISNVPGPREPLYFNGARMLGTYPLSIPTDGQAANITVTTYAGSLEVGITGCRRAVPSMQRMLEHLETSLAELEAL